MRFVFPPDTENRLSAGEIYCPRCVQKTLFWVIEGHENRDEPDVECEACGYVYTTVQKIVRTKDGETTRKEHQLPAKVRRNALREFAEKQRRDLISQGFWLEDIPEVVVDGDLDG